MGSDRKKRKYHQSRDGNVNVETYHVKRPKVSSEYQPQMGAIDGHNFRRQPGRGAASLEKVCVTRSAKDRIFINIVGWVLVNIYLATKYFVWNGEARKSLAEVQEKVAMSLVNNQWLSEGDHEASPAESTETPLNDISHCKRHPTYASNLCRHCRKHKTVFYCAQCSNPKAPKLRRDRGRISGAEKHQRGGYMHFCKGECFLRHKCGNVRDRRPRKRPAETHHEL